MNFKNALLAGLILSTSTVMPAIASAQDKHHKAKAIAAGIAAYEVAKHTGKPGRKNFLQKHPMLTGIGTAMVVNHKLKKAKKH